MSGMVLIITNKDFIMQDLTLISERHQRYENNVPVMGMQFAKRALIIKNMDFCQFMKTTVSPADGFIVRMINMDAQDANGNYRDMMQPKLMEMVSDNINRIELKGVALKLMGVTCVDYSAYSISLHLINRKVVKCVLHMLDRGVDIEYLDIQ